MSAEEASPQEDATQEKAPVEAAPQTDAISQSVESSKEETKDATLLELKESKLIVKPEGKVSEPRKASVVRVESTKISASQVLEPKIEDRRRSSDKKRASITEDDRLVSKRRLSGVYRVGSKAREALGSIISIKRGSITDEFGKKTARYMNTYKLDSDNPFNPEKVVKILKAVMREALDNLTYEPTKCGNQAKWATKVIRSDVKDLEFDRYKIICYVSIGEKKNQDVYITCRFLWDSERDRFAQYSLENNYVYGVALCFGLYYE